ncbi:hypothetical protein GCM10023146_30680 [Nocardioides caricicola]
MLAIHGAIERGAAKTGYDSGRSPTPANGTSWWQIARVGVLDGRLERREHRVPVVALTCAGALVVLGGAVPDGVVPQQVAAHDQRDRARLPLLGLLRRVRAGGDRGRRLLGDRLPDDRLGPGATGRGHDEQCRQRDQLLHESIQAGATGGRADNGEHGFARLDT